MDPEAETPNNLCPSKFSQVCPDFPFVQNTNLYMRVSTVQIYCTDLRFGGNENVDTLEKK